MSLFAGLFSVEPSNEASLFKPDSKFKAKPEQLATPEIEAHVDAVVTHADSVNGVSKKSKTEKSKNSKKSKAEKESRSKAVDRKASAKSDDTASATAERKKKKKLLTETAETEANLEQVEVDEHPPRKKKKTAVKEAKAQQQDTAAVEPEQNLKSDSEDDDDLEQDAGDKKHQKKKLSPEELAEQAEKLTRTVFVGNLPKDIEKKRLKKLFSKYGPVESVRLRSYTLKQDSKVPRKVAIMTGLIDKERGSVHAYVVFETAEHAESALKANMTVVGDNHIRVDRAALPANKGGAHQSLFDPPRTVFVGNLHFEIEDEELIKFFTSKEAVSSAPELRNAVEAVRVVRDAKTQLGKGFALVLFKNKTAARAALDLHEQKLRNRPVRISRAKASQVSGGSKVAGGGSKPHPGGSKPGDKTDGPAATGSKREVWQGVKIKPGSKKLGTKSWRSATGPTGTIGGGVVKKRGVPGGRGPGGLRSESRPGKSGAGGKGAGKTAKRPAVVARKAAQLRAKGVAKSKAGKKSKS